MPRKTHLATGADDHLLLLVDDVEIDDAVQNAIVLRFVLQIAVRQRNEKATLERTSHDAHTAIDCLCRDRASRNQPCWLYILAYTTVRKLTKIQHLREQIKVTDFCLKYT